MQALNSMKESYIYLYPGSEKNKNVKKFVQK